MKIKSLFLSLLAVVCFAACSDDDEPKQPSHNYISLATEDAKILTEDSEDSIHVKVLLGNALQQPATITFALENNTNEVLAIDQPILTFAAGEKEKSFNIYSNRKSIVNEPLQISVGVKEVTDPSLILWTKDFNITVNRDSDIPSLSDRQKALLKSYKDNLGLDIERMMGKLRCEVKVIFPADEKGIIKGESGFTEEEIKEYKTTTILTLSEEATESNPVLKMASNPMGITALYRDVLNLELAIVNKRGTAFPSVAEAVGFDEVNETFAMMLDNINIDENGNIDYLVKTVDEYEDSLVYIPFQYDFSAWNRQEQMIKENKTVDLITQDPDSDEIWDSAPDTPMSEAVEMGLTFEPEYYIKGSSIHSDDAWENGTWKAPTSKVDFAEGKLTFTFPWDHMNSSDWTLIEVTYTLHPAK